MATAAGRAAGRAAGCAAAAARAEEELLQAMHPPSLSFTSSSSSRRGALNQKRPPLRCGLQPPSQPPANCARFSGGACGGLRERGRENVALGLTDSREKKNAAGYCVWAIDPPSSERALPQRSRAHTHARHGLGHKRPLGSRLGSIPGPVVDRFQCIGLIWNLNMRSNAFRTLSGFGAWGSSRTRLAAATLEYIPPLFVEPWIDRRVSGASDCLTACALGRLKRLTVDQMSFNGLNSPASLVADWNRYQTPHTST